jgi:hypothetical protein
MYVTGWHAKVVGIGEEVASITGHIQSDEPQIIKVLARIPLLGSRD